MQKQELNNIAKKWAKGTIRDELGTVLDFGNTRAAFTYYVIEAALEEELTVKQLSDVVEYGLNLIAKAYHVLERDGSRGLKKFLSSHAFKLAKVKKTKKKKVKAKAVKKTVKAKGKDKKKNKKKKRKEKKKAKRAGASAAVGNVVNSESVGDSVSVTETNTEANV